MKGHVDCQKMHKIVSLKKICSGWVYGWGLKTWEAPAGSGGVKIEEAYHINSLSLGCVKSTTDRTMTCYSYTHPTELS